MYEDAHLEEAYELRTHIDDAPLTHEEIAFDQGGPIDLDYCDEEDRDAMLDEQEMMQAELEAEARLAQYDDDPSPYDGTYSEC